MLQQTEPLDCFNNIHHGFGVTTIDKANSNIWFICQLFYGFVFIKKLGLDQNATIKSETYMQLIKLNNQVISDHPTILKNKLI